MVSLYAEKQSPKFNFYIGLLLVISKIKASFLFIIANNF